MNGIGGSHGPASFLPYGPNLLASMNMAAAAAAGSPSALGHLPNLMPPLPSSAAALSMMAVAGAAAAAGNSNLTTSSNTTMGNAGITGGFRSSIVPSPPGPGASVLQQAAAVVAAQQQQQQQQQILPQSVTPTAPNSAPSPLAVKTSVTPQLQQAPMTGSSQPMAIPDRDPTPRSDSSGPPSNSEPTPA